MTNGGDEVFTPPRDLRLVAREALQRANTAREEREDPLVFRRVRMATLMVLASLGMVFLNLFPRSFSPAAEVYGWPCSHSVRLLASDGRFIVGSERSLSAMFIDVAVALLFIGSLPALKTIGVVDGKVMWSLRDLFVLMIGAALLFSLRPHPSIIPLSICPCVWLTVLPALVTFFSAPAALFALYAAWRKPERA